MPYFYRTALTVLLATALPFVDAVCNQDNLLRCFQHTAVAASQYCSSLAPSTVTVATTTVPIRTDVTTQTFTVSTLTTTVNAYLKRDLPPIPSALSCLTRSTSYPESRVTSACSCLGVPVVTVTVTYTEGSTTTLTASLSYSLFTATTSLTAVATATNTLAFYLSPQSGAQAGTYLRRKNMGHWFGNDGTDIFYLNTTSNIAEADTWYLNPTDSHVYSLAADGYPMSAGHGVNSYVFVCTLANAASVSGSPLLCSINSITGALSCIEDGFPRFKYFSLCVNDNGVLVIGNTADGVSGCGSASTVLKAIPVL
ncbi:hypothetical protein B0H63DRAFT_540250 [Podospora didyma]|uniref:Cyanovirin-N domain-containing protein n=1 Tax=Podospora didyma TaxID=330526 RepID=A0AAE0NRJ0_9PEZI|nr:hypothetical protein B0H63DRAFT_540250 [Podospora didyma]